MNLKGRGFRWWFIRIISLLLLITAYFLLAPLGKWPPYSEQEITELPLKDSTKHVEKKKLIPYVRKKHEANTPKVISSQEKELLLKIIDVQKAAINQKNAEISSMTKRIERLQADSVAASALSSGALAKYTQELDDLRKSIGVKVSSIPHLIKKAIDPEPSVSSEPKMASTLCSCPKTRRHSKKAKTITSNDRRSY